MRKQGIVREWTVRLALLLAGLCVAHFGVALFLLSDLGSDPFRVPVHFTRVFQPDSSIRSTPSMSRRRTA